MRDVVIAGPGPTRPRGARPTLALVLAGAASLSVALATASCGGDGGPTEPAPRSPEGPPPGAATGALEVMTATSGPEPDPDGYTVSVADGDGRSIGTDDTLLVEGLEEDDLAVELSNLAGNCAVDGDNPLAVTVVAADTVPAEFAVVCAGRGALEVTTSTVAGDLDGDGFRVAVDGGQMRSIGTEDAEVFAGLAAGDHVVALSGLAAGCVVDGDNPRDATAPAGDTARVAMAVTCGLRGHVAFTSDRGDGGGEPGVYAMEADGSGDPVRLTEDGGFSPTFSPDGARIAFSSRRVGGALDVFVRVVDGSAGTERLTLAGGSEPAWSPDGSRIAFESRRAGLPPDVHVMNADGSGSPDRLTTGGGFSPAWSPDGTRIAFASRRDGEDRDIYVMEADGSTEPVRLTVDGGWSPSWSPDGTRIAFASDRDGDADVYKVCVDVEVAPVALTDDGARDDEPAWSPDGATVAFVSERDMNEEVYVVGADGSDPRNLSGDAADDRHPAWSPPSSSGGGPGPGLPLECQVAAP